MSKTNTSICENVKALIIWSFLSEIFFEEVCFAPCVSKPPLKISVYALVLALCRPSKVPTMVQVAKLQGGGRTYWKAASSTNSKTHWLMGIPSGTEQSFYAKKLARMVHASII
jgi:hypothetical protein